PRFAISALSRTLLFFSIYVSHPLRHLHSFPTRRSSDLTLFMLGLMLKLLSWDQRERLTLFIIKRFQKVRIQKKQEIKRLKNIKNDLLTLILPQVLAWLMM